MYFVLHIHTDLGHVLRLTALPREQPLCLPQIFHVSFRVCCFTHTQTWATSSGTRPSHVSSPFVCHRVSCKFLCILFYTYTQTWATSSGTRPSHVSSPFVCHRVSCKFSCILFYTYTQTWTTSSGTRPSHVSSPCCEESPEAPAEDRRSKPPALLPLAFLLPPATSVTLSLPSACVCVRACMCTRVCCMRV